MRVLIVGLPLFAERLKNDLENFDTENSYYFLDTYYNKWDKIKSFFLIPFVDVVYSINGALDHSGVFDLALKKNKKLMMTWVGTDVVKAKKLESINEDYLNNAHHYCEVSWIKNELKELNIDAKVLNFFNFKDSFNLTFPQNEKSLKVLTYISKGREEYYGWSTFIASAEQLPNVQFTVVGTDRSENIPGNVTCLGWVEDMESLFQECHCTIRFVEHDGLSGFVLESLYRGKHVLYSEDLTHCIHVNSSTDMVNRLSELSEKLNSKELTPNYEGSAFVKENFNSNFILSELIKEFQK